MHLCMQARETKKKTVVLHCVIYYLDIGRGVDMYVRNHFGHECVSTFTNSYAIRVLSVFLSLSFSLCLTVSPVGELTG